MTRQPKSATRYFVLLSLIAVSVLLLVGCSGPKRVEAPKFDPEAASADAISMYDEDGDGELSKSELKLCGSLLGAIDEIDTDGSKTISKDEIMSRVEHIMQGRDGRISIACRVVKGNAAVQMATVTFEPESFMGPLLEPASGETNSSGMAVVGIDDEMGGVLPGFYKVRISRQNKGGKEMIKGKYNEDTVLGQEVTSGSRQLSEGIIYNIK